MEPVRIGTAGWTLPKASADQFPAEGTHLQRYAGRFNCVEINSSFYKPHRPATYARWAESVPEHFRFSAKVPKEITHKRKLVDVEEPLTAFLSEVAHLGAKLGPLLVQLPPSSALELQVAESFMALLRERFAGPVVWEPRHLSWFDNQAERLFERFSISRVAAHPAVVAGADAPGGDSKLFYYRLHGAPRIYYSEYSSEQIAAYASDIKQHVERGAQVWCLFDNTALGSATSNALELQRLLH